MVSVFIERLWGHGGKLGGEFGHVYRYGDRECGLGWIFYTLLPSAYDRSVGVIGFRPIDTPNQGGADVRLQPDSETGVYLLRYWVGCHLSCLVGAVSNCAVSTS